MRVLLLLSTMPLLAADRCPALLLLENQMSAEAREEAGFIAQMETREGVYDWNVRLVYADWLEERGTPTRIAQAQTIRLEHDMATRWSWWSLLYEPRLSKLKSLRELAGWDTRAFIPHGLMLRFHMGIPNTLHDDRNQCIDIWKEIVRIPTITHVTRDGIASISAGGFATYELPLYRWAIFAAQHDHAGAYARLRHAATYDDIRHLEAGGS